MGKCCQVSPSWTKYMYSLNKCQYGLWRLWRWWCHDHKGLPQQHQLPKHLTMKKNWAEASERCLHSRNTVIETNLLSSYIITLKTSHWYNFFSSLYLDLIYKFIWNMVVLSLKTNAFPIKKWWKHITSGSSNTKQHNDFLDISSSYRNAAHFYSNPVIRWMPIRTKLWYMN